MKAIKLSRKEKKDPSLFLHLAKLLILVLLPNQISIYLVSAVGSLKILNCL